MHHTYSKHKKPRVAIVISQIKFKTNVLQEKKT